MGLFGNRPRCSDAHQKSTDGGRDVHPFGEAGHKQHGSKRRQQHDLIRLMRRQAAERQSIASRDPYDQKNRYDRHQFRESQFRRPTSRQKYCRPLAYNTELNART